jgi:hypothetical protein
MSIDRYHIIFYSFKRFQKKLTSKQCFIIISIIWILSLLISSVHLFNNSIQKFYVLRSNKIVELSRCLTNNLSIFEYYKIILVIIQYVIPVIILCYTYSCIGLHIYFFTSPPSSLMKRTNQMFYRFERSRRKVLLTNLFFNFIYIQSLYSKRFLK